MDRKGALARMPAAVWALGLVSMLMDISSEMIHSLLPMFMVGALGMSAFAVGLIEGLAEATALIVKVFSGALSDWLGRRKRLALFGYALGALSKPLFAIASRSGLGVAARLTDRIGKGIRGAPRDALVIYRRTKNLRAVQLLLGHSKLESTVRYLGIEVDDALEISEQTEI